VTTTSTDRIWAALDTAGFHPEERRDGRFKALCPVHGESHRSLSVTYVPSQGKTLLHCFACNASALEILAALGLELRDAYDKPLERTRGPHTRRQAHATMPAAPPRIAVCPPVTLPREGWVTVASYDYATGAGQVIERVHRRELTLNGVRHKKFVQQFRQPDGSMGWTKPADFTPVFYRHPSVTAAINAGETIWILEGEKDVENAVAAGIRHATTNAQGAGQFPDALLSMLRGPVIVVADRDLAGYTRARDLRDALRGLGVAVTVLLPATRDEKSDLTDHLDAGFGVSDLVAPTDTDLAVMILTATVGKLLEHGIRRDLEEIAAHRSRAAVDGDAEGAHLDAARYWANQVATAWTPYSASRLCELVVDGPLTNEGFRAALQLGRHEASGAALVHGLRQAKLID
jgi:hypothetical protein